MKYEIKGSDILTILISYDLTQRELAKILDTDGGTISRLINGHYRNTKNKLVPKRVELLLLGKGLKCWKKGILLWLIKNLL